MHIYIFSEFKCIFISTLSTIVNINPLSPNQSELEKGYVLLEVLFESSTPHRTCYLI